MRKFESVYIFSAVPDRSLFERVGFYKDDCAALRLFAEKVVTTNSVFEIASGRPNALIAYFYSKALVAAIVGRLVGARVIFTGGADQISSRVNRGARLLLFRMLAFCCLLVSDRVVVSCSDDLAAFRRIARFMPALARKVAIHPHAVQSVPEAKRAVTDRSSSRFDALTICWLGSEGNAVRKGLRHSIRLIALLRRIGIDAYLDVVGTDGPGRSVIDSAASRFGVEGFVRFVGIKTDEEKFLLFAERSAYLQLSAHEGFGVAAAEAFLAGMVVVHSNRGGLKDVIGLNGLIVDIEQLEHWGARETAQFFDRFRSFRVCQSVIKTEAAKYSLEARGRSLLS